MYGLVLTSASTGMGSLISKLSEVVTAGIGWVGDVASAITADGNEIILFTMGFLALGGAVGILGRMIRR